MASAQQTLQPTIQRTIVNEPVEVVSDPEILGGTPIVSGTRVPAEIVLVYLKDGAGVYEIVSDYPHLPFGAVEAVQKWARLNNLL